MAVTIRLLGANDAMAYKASRLHALKTEPSAYGSAYETTSKLADKDFVDRVSFSPGSFIYGAFSDAPVDELSLVGTAGGFVDRERKRNHIGYIVGVWAHKYYRRQGIARRLTKNVIGQLREVPDLDTLQLSVTANNAGAADLYQQLGFKIWGEEPRALRVNDDYFAELHMSMRIR